MSVPIQVPQPTVSPAQTYIQPYPNARPAPLWLVRTLIVLNLALGTNYLVWRYSGTINWPQWWVAIPLIIAETYSLIDAFLFGTSMWKWRGPRTTPPAPAPDLTVDVFITSYNEPVDLVRTTARAARAIRYPHRTYILDDGNCAEMAAMARQEGVGYLTRSAEWRNRPRHAKAGNLINALSLTEGQFIAILDADQIPAPEFLDRTLGYFSDPKVAFVQTPQFFYNVPPDDPFGAQAPLFYGPIQEGKGAWNAAFFCGSNAVLRREALMFTGIAFYVRDTEAKVRATLKAARRMLRRTTRSMRGPAQDPHAVAALRDLDQAVTQALQALAQGKSIQAVTWDFQRKAEVASRLVVDADLENIRADLAEIAGRQPPVFEVARVAPDEASLHTLAGRTGSPLGAVAEVRSLLVNVDVDRAEDVHAVLPLATISVTEDLATAMRMHSMGWSSVYHGENLVIGLAPEDFGSAMIQRLRWAQGTLQVMFRENPLTLPGLSVPQRLMYFGTMWTYLFGLVAPIYLLAPIFYLFFGWRPVTAYSMDFVLHLVPFLLVNEIMFAVIGRGRPTWRGRQYSLALFPLWLTALWTSAAQVYFGRNLPFAVTPKTRQGRVSWMAVRWQIASIVMLTFAGLYGIVRLVLGTPDTLAISINLFWISYDILLLSVVFRALRHVPPETSPTPESMHVLPVGGR